MNSLKVKRRGLVAALMTGSALTSGLMLPQIAFAQDTEVAIVEQTPDATVLSAITLYGDRTTTSLDESRASVAVVGGEPAAAPQPVTVRDAFRQMANVESSSALESGFVIRGVNSEGLVPGGADAPLASVYVDGVQQTVNGVRRGSRSMFDVEQIEVYRGPQSTLSGRAALAGAVYVRTKDPEFAPSGTARLAYGSDNHKYVGLAYGDALSDNLAYRISAEWSEKDNDIKYPSYKDYENYDDFVTDDYYTLRAKLLWLPTGSEATRVLFSYSRSYDSPIENIIAGENWPSTPRVGYGDYRGDIWGELTPDDTKNLLQSFGLPGDFPAYQENRNSKVDNFGIEVTHELSDFMTLTALTGASRSLTERNSINYGPADEMFYTAGEFQQRTYSQEVRLNYDNGADLKWVAGIYAAKINNDAWRDSRTYSWQKSTNTIDITNVALFGETTWEFMPSWKVIAGGRVDRIKQEQTGYVNNFDFLGLNGGGTTETTSASDYSDTVFLPKLGLEYAIDEANTVALVYQRGYRPGGAGILAVAGTIYEYDPEYTENYELSWRGSFMDDRLTVGANAFWQKWKDQQVEVRSDPTTSVDSYIGNAGEAKSRGLEVEVAYEATDQLSLFGSAGHLKSEFVDFNLPDYGDFTGNSFANAPETTIALGFRWTGDNGWFGAASARYSSSQNSSLEKGVPNPVRLDSRTIVDAEFGYTWNQATITAYATNLFDKDYFVYESGPGVVATLGDRREIGLRLDYSF